MPECWKEAGGCFVPKEKYSVTINQFRTISLLNVKVKLYMSVLAKQISWYMVENSYIDTEARNTMVLRMHRAHKCHKPAHLCGKERQEELCSSVLDLANAFGYVPHQLIELAMELY